MALHRFYWTEDNPAGWTTSAYPITLASGTNSITLISPTGNLFFRLHQ